MAFARKFIGCHDVIIPNDEGFYDAYVKALGKDHVAIAPMPDIWTRNFAVANPARPVMFRYTAAGQGGGKKGQVILDVCQISRLIYVTSNT